MNKSDSIAKLAQPLCLFQGEITNPKNVAENPFFHSQYCPLNEVINTTRPILAKQGLSVLQSPSGDGERIIITTLLMHSSGEWIEANPLVLKADKITAQGAGSAISYGRRYALSAMLGISSDADDDGNHATGNKPAPQRPAEPKMDWVKFWESCFALGYTRSQVEEIAKTKDFSKWTREQANKLYGSLKNKGDK